MEDRDIRWEQRFSNYKKALAKLAQAVLIVTANQNDSGEAPELDTEDEMLKESLVKRFEFTHELAWKVMKDYAEFQGKFDIKGPKDATRDAFSVNLIVDGDVWMNMIKSRNLTVHTYDEETVEEICRKIVSDYYPAFSQFSKVMDELRESKKPDLF